MPLRFLRRNHAIFRSSGGVIVIGFWYMSGQVWFNWTINSAKASEVWLASLAIRNSSRLIAKKACGVSEIFRSRKGFLGKSAIMEVCGSHAKCYGGEWILRLCCITFLPFLAWLGLGGIGCTWRRISALWKNDRSSCYRIGCCARISRYRLHCYWINCWRKKLYLQMAIRTRGVFTTYFPGLFTFTE